MFKRALLTLVLGFGSLTAIAAVSNNPNINEGGIESFDCSSNPQACRKISGYNELRQLCTNYHTADRQLPPSKFEYQCKLCRTDWVVEKKATPLPLYVSKESNFLTNKGKFSWANTQTGPTQMSCNMATEVIYKIEENVVIGLDEDFDCRKVLGFASEKDFHQYLEENYCTTGFLQEQGIEPAAKETGRYIDTCQTVDVKSKVPTQEIDFCPGTESQVKPVEMVNTPSSARTGMPQGRRRR